MNPSPVNPTYEVRPLSCCNIVVERSVKEFCKDSCKTYHCGSVYDGSCSQELLHVSLLVAFCDDYRCIYKLADQCLVWHVHQS